MILNATAYVVFTFLINLVDIKAGVTMGEIRENVKRNLGYYLSLRGISQKELAQRLNVSPSAVTNWIRGKNSPDIEIVAQICDILEISVLDLFGTEDNEQYSEFEKKIIYQYRKKPELQHAVNILLGIDDSCTNSLSPDYKRKDKSQ